MAEPTQGQLELQKYREAGFTADEMGLWAQQKRTELQAAGFSDSEIDRDYFGYRTFNPAPVAAFAQVQRSRAAPVTNFKEAWETGWGMGTASLGAAATTGGALPGKQVTEDTPWHLRTASNIATMANDAPAMVGGYLLGGGQITGLAGAFALPAALRHVFIDAIENGQIKTKEEFVDLAIGTMWETTKAWTVGAATGLAGKAVRGALPATAGPVARHGAPTAAELATMVAVGRGLEGALPSTNDWIDGATILFGMKGATAGAARLRNIWRKTGVTPQQIVDDVATDPKLWQEVIGSDKEVPNRYERLVENGPIEPQNRLASELWKKEGAPALKEAMEPALGKEPTIGGKKEPKLDPGAEQRAIEYFERPFLDPLRAPDEPARPPFQNQLYTDTPQAVKESVDKLSQLYEAQITDARRGVVPNKQSYLEAKSVLDELLGVKTKSEKLLDTSDFAKLTANVYARKEAAILAAEDLLRKREVMVAKGSNVAPEDYAQFLASIEGAGMVIAESAGAKAELGRAMQMLQSTKRMKGAERLEAVTNLLNQYGGEANLSKLMKGLDELKDPKQVMKFAREAAKASGWDMFVEAYRASLVSGLRTAEVNLMSTALFTGMRIPTRSVAAVYGKMHGGDKVMFGETAGAMIGLTAGTRDAMAVTAATLKHGILTAKEQGVAKGAKEVGLAMENASEELAGRVSAEGRTNAIPGVAGHVLRAPFLALSIPDLFLKTVNARSELYALAFRDAAAKGYGFGSKEFMAHATERINNPTPEMVTASQAAGMRNTFNAPPGAKSEALGKFIKEWHLEPVVPFRRTMGNLFKEGARMTPGLNLAVGEWRKDFAAGGAKRDMALAEVTVGFAIMLGVYAAAESGLITGKGDPDPRKRATDRAAGWAPDAIKIGNTYVPGHTRLAPYGILMGMAADVYEIKQYTTKEEHDRLLMMIGVAISKNVTNQTFMSGIVNATLAAVLPERYGESYLENTAGSLIPFTGLLGQIAKERDPLEREIEGALQAIQSRIPGWREGLRPKIDVFGETVKRPESLWYGSPFGVSVLSTDKVRTEAMAVGFTSPLTPKTTTVKVGKDVGSLNEIRLTPEQRDIFATEAGKMAHAVLAPLVNTPGWDKLPQLLKRQYYERAFEISRRYAGAIMLTPKEQMEATEVVISRIQKELQE